MARREARSVMIESGAMADFGAQSGRISISEKSLTSRVAINKVAKLRLNETYAKSPEACAQN